MKTVVLCAVLLLGLIAPSLQSYQNSDSCPAFTGLIFAGQTIDAGEYSITSTSAGIEFDISTHNGWKVSLCHIYAGTTVPGHNPGSYPVHKTFSTPATSWSYTFPFSAIGSDVKCGSTVYVAIHCDMVNRFQNCEETGWAYGEHQFSLAWGWYRSYTICCDNQNPTTRAATSSAFTTKAVTTQAYTTQAVTTQAVTTKDVYPQTTQAVTTQAVTTQQVTTYPVTTQPVTTQPVTTQPVTTQAVTTQEVTTQAVTTQEVTTQAVTTQEVTTQPVTTQPVTTQPVTTQPVTTQPVTTQPVTTQPVTTQPVTTYPVTTQPVTTQPVTTYPVTTEAVTTKPVYPQTTGTPYPPPPPPPPPHIPPYQTDCDSDGRGHFFGSVPSLFNVFVFDDFYCLNSDTEGRIAAGGDITITNYAVGCKLYPPPVPAATCIEYGSLTCVDAINMGDWIDNLVAGGALTATSSQLWIGNVIYGTSLNSDFTFNFQKDCYMQQEHVIDFNVWEEYEKKLSAKLCAMSTTGSSATEEGWRLVLSGTGAIVDVFDISGDELCGPAVKGFDIEGTGNGSTIIVNVHGDVLSCGGYSMGGFGHAPYDASKVLFNFCEATSITLHDIQWRGSILAPLAAITPTSGAISGQIIAKSFISYDQTCLQQNWEPFDGCIPDACLNVNPRPYCSSPQSNWELTCPVTSIDTVITERTPVIGACALDLAFDTCYGRAGVAIGCNNNGHFLALSSVQAIKDFLPQTDTVNMAPLTRDYLNPLSTSAGAAAGELVSLVLSRGFDKCLADKVGLCSLMEGIYICGLEKDNDNCHDFYGYTIGQLIDEANQVIGGCPGAGAHSIQKIHSCLKTVNLAFQECKTITAPKQTLAYCPCDQQYCPVLPLSLQDMTADTGSTLEPGNTEPGIETVAAGNGLAASLLVLLFALLGLWL